MKNYCTIRSLILIFCFIFSASFSQETLYLENFGTGTTFPAGWTGDVNWSVASTGSSTGYEGASGGSQARTSTAAGSLTYGSLSTEGYQSISVIWGARRTSTQSPVNFQWSIDGTSWNSVSFSDVAADSNWALVNGGTSIVLPASTEGVTNLSFRWEVSSGGTYRIDDFLVTGLSGTGSPVLISSETEINQLDYAEGNGPSVSQFFELSGANLNGTDVTLTLGDGTGSDFEISFSELTGYSDTNITLTNFNGDFTTIFVRLKESLITASYLETLTITGGGASAITINLSGEVITPIFLIYEFTGDVVSPAQSPPNATTSDFLISAANVNFGTTGTWSGSGVPYAQGNTGWDATAVNDAKNFFFTIDADAGYELSLSNISFEWRTTGAGPSAITVEVNGTEISTFNSGANVQATFNEALTGFEDLSNVEVRIKGWNNGSRPTSGGGSFRINDVRLDGSINELTPDYTFNSGSWTPVNPSGISTHTDIISVLDGSAVINGTLEVGDLLINENASLNLTSTGLLKINSRLTNNGNLVFHSDASGTAQFDLFNGSISGSGNVIAERYIPAKRAFRLVSSSVGGQTIANAWQQDTHITGVGGASNGFDATASNNPSMFTFDNSLADQSNRAAWVPITSTSGLILAGTPYRLFVRGDRNIDLTNNNATPSVTTLKATGEMQVGSFSPTLSAEAGNYSFVGNPYQAVVDFKTVTKSNLTNFIFVWDASIAGENGNGGYVTVEISTGNITAPSASSSDASEFIAPGQAFFVQNTTAGNGSITFEETSKATNQPQVNVFSDYPDFYINSRLYKTTDLHTGNTESDAIGLRFNENFTTLGSDEDASKLANPGENYAVLNNGFKSIDKQDLPKDGHEINLAILNYQVSAYSLTFVMDNKPAGLKVYLNDNYLETKTELFSDSIYEFTVDSTIDESRDSNRFKLSFEQTTLSREDFTKSDLRLYPNPVQDILTINAPTSIGLKSVKLYNMFGQEVKSAQTNSVNMTELSSGVYLVEIKTKSGKLSKMLIKE